MTLNIEALAEPELAEESGVAGPANPYSNANVHDFKTGNSGSYANATFSAGDRSVQLTVDENGIVSTTEDITAGGTYRLTARATSPDFIGTATLELRLDLAAEGEFTPARTIPSSQRSQDVVVVPGYSGSVAFFAAQTLGVTLRTPAAAPTDFSFGTDGADRDYASPDGFTLFLDDGKINAAGETAVGGVCGDGEGGGLHNSGSYVDGECCGADGSGADGFDGAGRVRGLRRCGGARELSDWRRDFGEHCGRGGFRGRGADSAEQPRESGATRGGEFVAG